jgi:hypothetical protein
MPYSLSASDLKQLYGARFQLQNLQGVSSEFTIPTAAPTWPRSGQEAYGLLVECQHPDRGRLPSFLKVFKQDVPARAQRTAYLIRLGLANHHPWLYQGMPYVAFHDFKIGGVSIHGHIARQILGNGHGGAEDLARLRTTPDRWAPSPDQRRRLAGHLCCAVAGLEDLQLCHGDLSPRNLVIGAAPDGEPAAILCDYDGFFHPDLPALPDYHDNRPCRPLGTPGFQAPELLERIENSLSSAIVRSDRFALAVLVCEILVWNDMMAQLLNREELLTPDLIRSRDLKPLPRQVLRAWPDGFDLLQSALSARDPGEMPSPDEWIALLIGVRFIGRPQIRVSRRRGQAVRVGEVRLTSDAGDLSRVHPELAPCRFEVSTRRQGCSCRLTLGWQAPVMIRRRGQSLETLGQGPLTVHVAAGDKVHSNQWELEILDSAHA